MPDNLRRETRARLICMLAASDELPAAASAQSFARAAREQGETVLVVKYGLAEPSSQPTLADVLSGEAQLCDTKLICANSGIVTLLAGRAKLEDMLGILAALSLSYDNVIIAPPAGCTPAHVRLAVAADVNVLHFDSHGDKFMRAYWMLDALRARCPGLDPMLVACGPKADAEESYEMLRETVREFLGAPLPLSAIISHRGMADGVATHILSALNHDDAQKLRA